MIGCVRLFLPAFVLILIAAPSETLAEELHDAPDVVLHCDAANSPGRVRCEAEARAPSQGSIAWGDVQIIKVPEFVAVLRGRIGPHEIVNKDAGGVAWPFAVVAKQRGEGEVVVRVRLLVCEKERCVPREATARAALRVGVKADAG